MLACSVFGRSIPIYSSLPPPFHFHQVDLLRLGDDPVFCRPYPALTIMVVTFFVITDSIVHFSSVGAHKGVMIKLYSSLKKFAGP